jgi:hypothetical protein
MFGGGGSVGVVADSAAVSGAEFILNLAMRMTDPERRAFREEAERWLEAGREYAATSKAHAERERVLNQRDTDLVAREAAAARRESELAERKVQIRAAAARVEEQRAEIAELKADLRRAWAA